jgi:hypothetical protein
MRLDEGIGTERQDLLMIFKFVLLRASWIAALALCFALQAHAYAWYSGASVGSDGTIYGYGVTDGTPPPGMNHTAYITVTLTSPKNRQNSGGQQSNPSIVQENVQLSFDPSDLGNYVVNSISTVYCHSCCCNVVYNEPSQASHNDAPAKLVPYDYPPCAPKGVGPLQILSNQSVVNCAGTVIVSGFDGVNRNLIYQLVDSTGTPFPAAYHIAESFSNFQKTPSTSGLGQPTALQADVPAGGLTGDYQYAGYSYPTYP